MRVMPVHRAKVKGHRHSGGFPAPAQSPTIDDDVSVTPLRIGPFRPLLERPRSIKPGGLVAQTARSGSARGHAAAGGLSIAASRRILPATLPADVWGGTTVHVAEEPSVASAGRVVLYALNWDTAYSTNGGKTFTEMDPHTTFPPVHYTSGPVQCNPTTPCFCCDQVVMYDPKFDRFIWVLQYNSDSAGENVIRVAYASSSKLATLGPKAWSWFDLPSFDLAGTGNFLDQPKLGFTPRYLYMNINEGASGGSTVSQTVVVRIPRAGFADPGGPGGYGWAVVGPFSLRVAQDAAGSTEFFVGHKDTSSLRVLSVDDSSNSIDVQDISSPTIATSNWTLRTPGGDDMFRRQANSQFNAVTGVTQAGDGSLWAAWTEPRNVVDSHGNLVSNATQLPQPHIGVAHLLTSSNGSTHSAQLDNQTEYYNPGFGIALPDLTTDSAGEVAFSAYWGGGKYYANHAVGFLSGGFEWVADGFGTSDSYQGADLVKGNPYGDYETVRREAPPYGNCMVAASDINTFTQPVVKLAPDRPIFQFPPVSYPIFTIFSRPGVKCPPSFRTLPIGPLPTRAQPPPEPQASTVTLGCPPAGRAGTPMRFTGTLAPVLGGQQITITASGAASTSFSVQTGADGSFSATFTPPVAGQYQFAAGWSGNGQYAAGSSMPCGVAVAPIATTLTLSCPSSPTAGAPFPVSGTLSPAIPAAPITLTYTSSDTNTPSVTHGATTTPTGGFSDTAPASPPGTLTIAAHFAGDPAHAQSNQSCTVSVVPIIP